MNLGRQKSVTYSIGEAVDPFAIGLAGDLNRLFKTTTRRDNAVTYSTTNLGGFVGSAQYAFGEVAGNNTANRTVGLSGTYSAGPLYAALAYEKVNDANGNEAVGGKKVFLGGTYNFDVVKAHAAYETIKGTTSVTNLTETEQRIWMIGATVPVRRKRFPDRLHTSEKTKTFPMLTLTRSLWVTRMLCPNVLTCTHRIPVQLTTAKLLTMLAQTARQTSSSTSVSVTCSDRFQAFA